MTLHTIASARLDLTFGKDPSTVLKIRNRLTGEAIGLDGRQSLLVRTPDEISEPAILVRSRVVRRAAGNCTLEFTDAGRRYRAVLHIEGSGDGIRLSMRVTAPKPVWMVEWRLSGLQAEEIIVPALGGQSLDRRMPVDTTISYKYPFWWNAQFVIGAARRGGFWIHSTESDPRFKMLRVKREQKGFALTYAFEAPAPLKSNTLEAEWFIDGYKGTWREPVDRHRAWLEEAFNLVPLTQNPAFPEWAHDIDFVLELWGMRKDSAAPHHTFDQMADRLRAWKRMHDPRRTLVYLPGYAEHGIDSHAPDYDPSEDLGGPRKFKKLVDTAHKLGYRVMIHTNVLAMTFTHRLYPKFRKHQVVDPFGREQGWGLDLDGDWLFEPYFAYINPGAKEWGDLMERVLGSLIKKYGIDGVFLDQTLLAFNTSKGPNFLAGMQSHIRRLERAFPGVLFSGEGLHEYVLNALPMAQIHGLDSITEVHGLEGKARWRNVHPVSTYLFSKYTAFVAHLLTRHPSSPMFAFQESSYAKLGVIPALCLYSTAQKMEMPGVRRMVRRAETLNTSRRTRTRS